MVEEVFEFAFLGLGEGGPVVGCEEGLDQLEDVVVVEFWVKGKIHDLYS